MRLILRRGECNLFVANGDGGVSEVDARFICWGINEVVEIDKRHVPTRPDQIVYSGIDRKYGIRHGLPLGRIRKAGNKICKLAAVHEVGNDDVDRFGGAYCVYRGCHAGHDFIDVILQGIPGEDTVVNVGVGVVPDRKIIGADVKDGCIDPAGSDLLRQAFRLAGSDNIFRGRTGKRPIVFVPAAARVPPFAPWAYVNAAIALQLFVPVEGCRGIFATSIVFVGTVLIRVAVTHYAQMDLRASR